MQGKTLKIVFPAETFEFISKLAKKMTKTQAKQPLPDGTFMPINDPSTGQPMMMSKTGKVEEFIHYAVLQSLLIVIMSDAKDTAFLEERMKLQNILNSYGNFIQDFIGSEHRDIAGGT